MATVFLIFNYFIVYSNSNKIINCPSNRDCTTLCHDTNSCEDTTVNCPTNRPCHIECSNTSSCKGATINAAINQPLLVNCHAEMSCFNTTFHATQASMLNIFGCTSQQSCLDLSIYCPPHSNSIKNCFVAGNNNLAASNESNNSNGINIYAINGWNDIDINYNGSYNAAHFGKMHCTETFSVSCDIAYNEWSCMNPLNKCNNQMANTHQISSTIFTSETTETLTILTAKLHMLANSNSDTNNVQISIVLFILLIVGICLFILSISICAAFCLYLHFVKKSQKYPSIPKIHISHVSTESNLTPSKSPVPPPNHRPHSIDIGNLQHQNKPDLPIAKIHSIMSYHGSHLSIPSQKYNHSHAVKSNGKRSSDASIVYSINCNVQRKNQSDHVQETEREFSLEDVDLEKDLPLSPKHGKKVEYWASQLCTANAKRGEMELNNGEDRSSDSDMYIQSNQPPIGILEGTPVGTPKHSPIVKPVKMSIDIATDVSFCLSPSNKK